MAMSFATFYTLKVLEQALDGITLSFFIVVEDEASKLSCSCGPFHLQLHLIGYLGLIVILLQK